MHYAPPIQMSEDAPPFADQPIGALLPAAELDDFQRDFDAIQAARETASAEATRRALNRLALRMFKALPRRAIH